MRVTLDAFELACWAWAPDLVASQQRPADTWGARIVDWDYLFERLVQNLDGLPERPEPDACFSITVDSNGVEKDNRITESLKIHNGLKPYVDKLKSI
jgi:hypothetical protein